MRIGEIECVGKREIPMPALTPSAPERQRPATAPQRERAPEREPERAP